MGALARRIAALSGILLACASAAAAQNPPPRDTTRRDTISAGPARADSLTAPHRLPDSTGTRDSTDTDTLRPILPPLLPPGPIARGGRWVFDDDALKFLGALDLGELLGHVPGVTVVRGGWFGQVSEVSYAGQGAASVEIWWDGWRMDPLGRDSSAIDVGRIPIALASRIEVEVLPSVLRVYVITETRAVRRALTETSFATGDASTNTYQIRYLNRWKSGAGLALGVNWFGTDGPNTSSGPVNDLALWTKVTWTPTPLTGVEFQVISYSAQHDQLKPVAGGVNVPGDTTTRRDLFVRGHIGSRPDGLGFSFDALLGSTAVEGEGLSIFRNHASATAAWRQINHSLELTGTVRDAVTPLELEGRAAWMPFDQLTVSGYARAQQHEASRSSAEAGATAEFAVGKLGIHGALRLRDAVARPELVADTAQRVSDWSGGVSWNARRLWLDVSVERHGLFDAPTWDVFRQQLPQLTDIDVTTLTTAFRLQPREWFTVSGWVRHPLDPIQAAYEPPTHSNVTATLRSRMLPRYRRGVFDLSLSASLEGWGAGVAGRDSSGAPINFAGATSYSYTLEIKLVSAVLYWTMRNAGLERFVYLPGFYQGRVLQRYGVRWEFTN